MPAALRRRREAPAPPSRASPSSGKKLKIRQLWDSFPAESKTCPFAGTRNRRQAKRRLRRRGRRSTSTARGGLRLHPSAALGLLPGRVQDLPLRRDTQPSPSEEASEEEGSTEHVHCSRWTTPLHLGSSWDSFPAASKTHRFAAHATVASTSHKNSLRHQGTCSLSFVRSNIGCVWQQLECRRLCGGGEKHLRRRVVLPQRLGRSLRSGSSGTPSRTSPRPIPSPGIATLAKRRGVCGEGVDGARPLLAVDYAFTPRQLRDSFTAESKTCRFARYAAVASSNHKKFFVTRYVLRLSLVRFHLGVCLAATGRPAALRRRREALAPPSRASPASGKKLKTRQIQSSFPADLHLQVVGMSKESEGIESTARRARRMDQVQPKEPELLVDRLSRNRLADLLDLICRLQLIEGSVPRTRAGRGCWNPRGSSNTTQVSPPPQTKDSLLNNRVCRNHRGARSSRPNESDTPEARSMRPRHGGGPRSLLDATGVRFLAAPSADGVLLAGCQRCKGDQEKKKARQSHTSSCQEAKTQETEEVCQEVPILSARDPSHHAARRTEDTVSEVESERAYDAGRIRSG